MKLKKLCAALMSGVMAVSLFSGTLTSKNTDSTNSISDILENIFPDVKPAKVNAAVNSNFRRPINNESPVWIVHIDSWNYADPEKIIDLVPEDVLPYVVFNISLSINWSPTEHKWLMVQDGIECARSWMKACADKGVWTMIQPASGGQCHFPDYAADYDLDNTIFGEFFKEYPNFIGYNYCEQFWGFASADFPVTYQQRYDHFAALLKLCNKYGGYLDVSWCENQWGSALNPVAMLKTNSNWEKACRTYAQNFILEEKYTQVAYIEDVESEVYGAYISGYCGNYGVRWDDTGWSDYPWSGDATKEQYRLSTSLPIYFERMALNGMTVIDGPELVWADCVKGLWDGTDDEGYKYRQWDFFDQCKNVNVDIMRKFIDGTIRIPDRKEVIDRTKVVVIQDVNSGSNDNKYCSYETLFEGLYRISDDGNYKDNHNPYKSTGRYQTIPTVYALVDDLAKSIPVQIKQSTIPSRWSSISAKQAEFNKLYPDSTYANCYVGNNENTWITYYNSKVSVGDKGAAIGLKYNTCKTFDIKHQLYGSAVINEYSDHIDVYMNNYDEDDAKTLKTENITISGAADKPTFTAKDRGVNQTASVITESWNNGSYTLTVKHNGPVDISIKCSGNETGRQTSYRKSTQVAPDFPDFYTGARQYEGENFDMKNVEGNVTNGCNSGITRYQGMGFVKFGTKNNAAVKDTVNTTKAGTFKWTLRYSATSDVICVDLYVNGSKVKTLNLPKGSNYSDWKTVSENITLKSGENKIELKASSALPCSLYLDNFKVEGDFGDAVVSGKTISAFEKIEAEDYTSQSGTETEDCSAGGKNIGYVNNDDYIMFKNVDFEDGAKSFTASVATTKTGVGIEMYLDSMSGTPFAQCEIASTGGWQEWKTASANISAVTGTHNLYLKFKGEGEDYLLNVDSFTFGKTPVTLNGSIITNLNVIDGENIDSWSVNYNFNKGSRLFGDRTLVCESLPDSLAGAEYIRTACDSKTVLSQLAGFTASKDAAIYVAMDSRVTNPAPSWLDSWTKTSDVITTTDPNGNILNLELFRKSVKSGDTVILDTNGGSVESVNYIVLAGEDIPVSENNQILIGDVNFNGIVDVTDLSKLSIWLIENYSPQEDELKAADVDSDGKITLADLARMRQYISHIIEKF
ncbi:MAG: glycoside hydrolase family 98 domain-containing protein [Oscillospiraceae bacterium]|nr:glycoside hydrolase family 98 domain-containing protein [Oscillospiraceae bacterium]